ncbi:MAG: hypothetical protein GX130_01830 [Candidatus Hydrogenedens sp.]|nr:hypothetical protein [Candidatus Hydrogenedens sp.]
MRLSASLCLVIMLLFSFQVAQAERSVLYPENWTPGFSDGEGRFFHDFSYAGYRHGENLPDPANLGPHFDVVADFGADSQGEADSTASVQAAIHAAEAAGGGLVYFPAGIYRFDDQLFIEQSNIVLCGECTSNTHLYFTRCHTGGGRGHISFQGAVTESSATLLVEDGEALSFDIFVADASAFVPGDDVTVGWTISDEFVEEHGMTGVWKAFNGSWQPFFRRRIVSIDRDSEPQRVTLDVPLRYEAKIRDQAVLTLSRGFLSECGVMNLAVSDAIDRDSAWTQTQTQVIQMSGVKDSFVYRVRSFQSPAAEDPLEKHVQSGGIRIHGSKNVTVASCQFENSQHRGDGGNGYLFEVRQSNEILYQDCIARKGRHNFVQNWGFGATGIVWLRCESTGSAQVFILQGMELPVRTFSEYHHSLSMACLVDSCVFDDGWSAGNRRHYSTGAGHSATECVMWNTRGKDKSEIRSYNYGHGYVIGTKNISVKILGDQVIGGLTTGTEPWDYTEFIGEADLLEPQSLYESQRNRRLGLEEAALEVRAEHMGLYTALEEEEVTLRPLVNHGRGTLRYQWYRILDDGVHERLEDETGPTLYFPSARTEDTGCYFCEVRDDLYTRNSPTLSLVVEPYRQVPVSGSVFWITGGLAVLCCMVKFLRKSDTTPLG